MNKDDIYYIRNMLDFALKIQALLQDKDRHVYDREETLRVTLTHWLQVIGEAARQVSQPFQDTHTAISWRAMIGMRNRIVHDYLGIDDDIVWETATLRVPELVIELEKILLSDKQNPTEKEG
jgi:uncharacterized protein with HEPN domain